MKKSLEMKTITTRTMDAINYQRILAANAQSGNIFGFSEYPAKELPVPIPNECPCCNKVMANDLLPVMSINNIDCISDDSAEEECDTISVYRCTSCNHLFAIWSHHHELAQDGYSCDVMYQYPFASKMTLFSEDINKLAPQFVEIYRQAESAEIQGMNEICGMGYRRALEYLVDSYARYKNPSIEIPAGKNLSQKITEYIKDDRIRQLAEKATWLGNDATHLEKRHPNRDVSDMKKFIKYMITLIDADFAFQDATSIQKA